MLALVPPICVSCIAGMTGMSPCPTKMGSQELFALAASNHDASNLSE
jgi:hypothetical protein